MVADGTGYVLRSEIRLLGYRRSERPTDARIEVAQARRPRLRLPPPARSVWFRSRRPVPATASTAVAAARAIGNGDGGDAASDPTTAAATPQPVPANAAVLDELSAAFAERPTISIGGDELPDAVYLDDELERGVAVGATLFIDDDGSADAVAPKEASTRGIEPRLRQRRIGVRRAESRRRLRWVIVAGLVLPVVVAALAVLGSSLFAVKDVDVRATCTPTPTHSRPWSTTSTGTPVLRVDTLAAEEQLESIPWVEDARVTTKFPTRRRSRSANGRRSSPCSAPTARAACSIGTAGCSTLIEGQPVALVWISGPGTLDTGLGGTAPIGYSAAASFVTKLTPTIRSRVHSMTVTPDGSDLRLILTGRRQRPDRGPFRVGDRRQRPDRQARPTRTRSSKTSDPTRSR